MWFRRGEEIMGVLCGWDLAEDQENDAGKGKGDSAALRESQHLAGLRLNQQKPAQPAEDEETPRYRTGTGPFMAVDLLLERIPPIHKYRHDLESFFYVYVCAAATYHPDCEEKIQALPQWDLQSLDMIGENKAYRFFFLSNAYTGVFEDAHPEFRAVIDGPLFELYYIFLEIEHQYVQAQRMLIRAKRTGDSESVQEKVAELEKERDRIATYERFMEILGEPLK
ncbi:hypothetical protein FOMPIDRAFT_1050040 [Fomitopsis schrenkii]|uniref:Fungal-type protein kinase domain-containing protein n=1 Tax=Fomitopsis schrenkii TaxID=2126942 RepID=S8FFM4_FOMSC|nr:hypothetical protein FOMPIDRAFT_1050040 [Fomitopsis schrenkii]